MLRAIAALDVRPDHLLIDAMALDIDIPQTSIIKGDAKSISIAAASVLAKEHRDQYMKQLSKKYNVYGFEKMQVMVHNNILMELRSTALSVNTENHLNQLNHISINQFYKLIKRSVLNQFTIALSFLIIDYELNLRNRRMENEYPRVSR